MADALRPANTFEVRLAKLEQLTLTVELLTESYKLDLREPPSMLSFEGEACAIGDGSLFRRLVAAEECARHLHALYDVLVELFAKGAPTTPERVLELAEARDAIGKVLYPARFPPTEPPPEPTELH